MDACMCEPVHAMRVCYRIFPVLASCVLLAMPSSSSQALFKPCSLHRAVFPPRVPLLKMPLQQREPRAPPRLPGFPSLRPHSGESKPPSRRNVCHNKGISRRWSNAFERLCVLVRDRLGKHTGMSYVPAQSAPETLSWLTWAKRFV